MKSSSSEAGRIAVVCPYPYLDTIPSVCNAIVQLARSGYRVDVFSPTSPDFLRANFEDGLVRLNSLGRHWPRSDQQLRDRVSRTPLGLLIFCLRALCRGTRWLSRIGALLLAVMRVVLRHRRVPYRCFVGVDPHGLAQAAFLARWVSVPVHYFSLELLLNEEIQNLRPSGEGGNAKLFRLLERLRRSSLTRLKKRETDLSRKSPIVIIQDRERAGILSQENGISEKRMFLVPDSPMGHARRRPSIFWHQRFGLPSRFRIVLHAGSLDPWTGIEGILDSVRGWPENWVLVVHTRCRAGRSEVPALRNRPDRVYFSTEPVPRRKMETLYDAADVGIGFYVPIAGSTFTQKNIRSLGFSSGKLAYCLRAAKPVVVNAAPSVSGFIRKMACGVVVEQFGDIGEAIARIEKNYDAYSQNAILTFEEYLNFDSAFDRVVARIRECA